MKLQAVHNGVIVEAGTEQAERLLKSGLYKNLAEKKQPVRKTVAKETADKE